MNFSVFQYLNQAEVEDDVTRHTAKVKQQQQQQQQQKQQQQQQQLYLHLHYIKFRLK